ncbi:hypothetical protein ACVIHI_002661 [Bradyrhizobium sp. USDA 4524]|uniref:sunset domain-containing protein n=1 Tax=unclassified Bradyrhizobium TaxID=2631580 RepID=UPI00209FB36E|nr:MULTISPECIES: hypothetical protein [unclassified Bradyrhizobium]MCP1844418.1 hypothetical protein [Bradyrhizobium sp. USDA 4538]MCP1904984.1 hypothetical protein [Bradyrhizobium sp. USDA 4537]MCP1989360.1 hypothetical protein [Bradyrhizobium sp. USDA 4539]
MSNKAIVLSAALAVALIIAALEFAPIVVGCGIKGNISVSGERIYHTIGQTYYWHTRIDPFHGERWFCSEEAARIAGWRKARI